MVSDLLLLSGNDIPFPKGQLTIHQPTIKEIAYIGEESFFMGCELLNFSKEVFLSDEDQESLNDKSNFEVFMSIMIDKRSTAIQKNRISALMVLSLIFPDYRMRMTPNEILFKKGTKDEDAEEGKINKDNFEDFKEILVQMFCLKSRSDGPEYNPKGSQAKKIADKLKQGRQKAAAEKSANQKISVFSRYVSILAVGQYKTFEELLKYTVYQLFDEFERFELKEDNDVYFRAKLAGAKDLKEVDNWMKDIHS